MAFWEIKLQKMGRGVIAIEGSKGNVNGKSLMEK